jgi:hypothetical protein
VWRLHSALKIPTTCASTELGRPRVKDSKASRTTLVAQGEGAFEVGSKPSKMRDMTYLFDSRGQHIANLIGKQLHAPAGANIGHYLESQQIFIDMNGRYLGELAFDDRLLYNRSSPYRTTNFGNYGNYGNAGNYGNPGTHGSIGVVAGFADVEADWLKYL